MAHDFSVNIFEIAAKIQMHYSWRHCLNYCGEPILRRLPGTMWVLATIRSFIRNNTQDQLNELNASTNFLRIQIQVT